MTSDRKFEVETWTTPVFQETKFRVRIGDAYLGAYDLRGLVLIPAEALSHVYIYDTREEAERAARSFLGLSEEGSRS